ncbi:UBP-type zinc finger domain-containing protein [Knoellia sp. LjRoot47]|uniref:UBP-type zinc finger domain-containing protein n=1 Tax=Knoellia sp. LjRoot47 TaxID=3342330 RepID=UPI003ED0B6C7
MPAPAQFPVSGDIDPSVPPSGPGCAECTAAQGWWVHLRRCTACGHIGCCDTSPEQHATAHFRETGHKVVASFEPGESWFWNYETEETARGPVLAEPSAHPEDQPAPGPEGQVPDNWRDLIHR